MATVPSDQPPAFDVDDEFEDFMRRCYPAVKEHDKQYTESRRIFLAGMVSCFFYTLSLAKYDTDIAEKELRKLQTQLVEYFVKRMKKE
jgi:hypothetical protein